jgi:methylated-DNA-[protein]-cysteine S-methyltransferase
MKRTLKHLLSPLGARGSSFTVVSTELGSIAILARGRVVERVSFGHDTPLAAARAIGCADGEPDKPASDWLAKLAERLAEYAAGEGDDLLDIEVDTAHLSPFGAAVVEAVRQIPPGETLSYGQVAALAGRPRAARAVGRVMAQNRTPLIVPCHRVVGSGGRLGGFSAGAGLPLKRRLLELESRAAVADLQRQLAAR